MPVFVSQSEVNYKVDRLLTDLTAQQSSTTARWNSNKTILWPLLNVVFYENTSKLGPAKLDCC